jgi:hypothetical protein
MAEICLRALQADPRRIAAALAYGLPEPIRKGAASHGSRRR